MTVRIALMAVLLLAPPTACAAEPESYQTIFAQGMAWYRGQAQTIDGSRRRVQDYCAAQACFALAVAIAPSEKHRVEALVFLGLAEYEIRQDAAAKEAFAQVLASASATAVQKVSAQDGLGNLLLRRGDYGAARRQYEKILAIAEAEPASLARAHLAIGRTWEYEGNRAAACQAYRSFPAGLAKAAPRVALDVQFRLGACLLEDGQFAAARQALARCPELADQVPPAGRGNDVKALLAEAQVMTGHAYHAEKNYVKALETYRACYEENKSARRWVVGKSLFEAVTRIDSAYRDALNHADACLAAKQYDQARRAYEMVLAMPDVSVLYQAKARLGLGQADQREGKRADAIKRYERVLTMPEGCWVERAEARQHLKQLGP